MASIVDIQKLLEANNDKLSKTIEVGFSKVKNEMQNFKKEISELVSESLRETNDRIASLEDNLLKKDTEIALLKKEFELHKRKNNLVLFNLRESEESEHDLKWNIIELIQRLADSNFNELDIDDVYRIGKKNVQKTRPVILSLVSYSKHKFIISKSKLFKAEHIGISKDFPKEISDERKRLQPLLQRLKNEGKKVFLRVDELIVEGEKWNSETIEKEFNKITTIESPNKSQERKRKLPKLNLQHVNPDTPFQTPTKPYPIFGNVSRSVLKMLPGAKPNDKVFEVIDDE